MIAAGTLRYRVAFLSAVKTKATNGEESINWTESLKVRANVQFLKGSRTMTAGEAWNPTSVTVTCRANSVINNKMRIKWADQTYRIISINPDKIDRSLTIIADLINE